MSYKDYNDYELLYMVKESDENAYNLLYEKYKPLINSLSKKYSRVYQNYGIDINDFILEGYYGLDQAIKNFNEEDEYKFKGLATTCINRQMQNLIRNAKLKRNFILNNSLYYDSLEDSNEINYLEIKADEKAISPEQQIIENEDVMETYEKCINNLKGLELTVFILKIKGMTNEEIASKLDKPIKSISNAITRIRKKYNKL